jgi:quercetin dioxygenase-like cupin family protein
MPAMLGVAMFLLAGRADASPPPALPEGISAELLLESPVVRVARLTLQPGAAEPVHAHDHDFLAVSLGEGTLKVAGGGAAETVPQTAGTATFFHAGAPHAVSNVGRAPLVVLGAALRHRSSAPAAGADPVAASPNYRVLFDNERVRVLEHRLPAAAREARHGHPDYVVYAVTGGRFRATFADGRQADVTVEPGQALGRAAQEHALENTGALEARSLVIEVKP